MTGKKAGSVFLLAVLLHMVMVLILAVWGMFFPAVYDLWPSTLISEGVFLWPMLIFALCTPAAFSEMFPFKRVKVRTIFLSLLILVLIYPLITLVNSISLLFTESATQVLVTEATVTPMWQMLLLLGVVVPLIEECTFRGYIYGCLRSSGKTGSAVVLSALLFGLMHLNLNQASYTFLLGLFLAMMTELTGSLWPAVLMHGCFNGWEVIMMYTASDSVGSLEGMLTSVCAANGLDPAEIPSEAMNLLVNVSSVAILAVQALLAVVGTLLALLLVRRVAVIERGENPRRNKEIKPTGHALNVPLVLGILLAVGYILFNEMVLMQA